jgi:phosphomannomutase
MLNINTSAFHDYDIRGIYSSEINEQFYYHLGKALALYFKNGPIAVGYDARNSSPSLFKYLIKGIIDYGVDVVNLGMISTEIHNFASGEYDFTANIIVSASHNPPEYNGAKILQKGVKALHGSWGLPEIKELVNQKYPKAQKSGKVTKQDIFSDWINHSLSFIDVNKLKKLKVVVDAGNGMGGPSWVAMQKSLPLEIIPLYLDPDGNFPNHIADPLKDENILDLVNKVKETKADLGIALDGDADRAFFIDETGRKISGTITTAIFSSYLLESQKGYYLYNAICGRIVPETITKKGGKPVRTRVGHSFIKAKMQELSAVFCGEHSGHFFFGKNYGAESSLIAGLIMLELLSVSSKTLSQIVAEYDKYPSSGEINFKVSDVNSVQEALKDLYKDQAQTIDEVDGISVWFKDYWFNIRGSKTEPLLRLNLEADNQTLLQSKVSEVIKKIEDLGGERE